MNHCDILCVVSVFTALQCKTSLREAMSRIEQERTLIKKYGNRRLYSTATSSYITLAELEVLVRNGENVKVVDVSSNEDITSQILTQILVESGKAKSIPVKFLELMIRQREDLLEILLNQQTEYFELSVDVTRHAQDEFIRIMQRAMHDGMVFGSPLITSPIENMNRDRRADNRVADLEREVQELKKMVREQNDGRRN